VIPFQSTRWMLGLSCATAILDGVKNNSLASKAGFRKGDEIVEVNSKPVTGFTDIRKRIMDSEEETVVFTVKRNQAVTLISALLGDERVKDEFLDGLSPFYGLKVDSLVNGYPAEKVGLRPGDTIISLNEKELKDWNSLLQQVVLSQGKPMVIEWMRGDERFVSPIEPQKDEKLRWEISG